MALCIIVWPICRVRPLTSSEALYNATFPLVIALAEKGLKALDDDPHLANGLNVTGGKIVNQAVIDSIDTQSAN